MRSEEQIRETYRKYLYMYAIADLNGRRHDANQYFGATFATGRILGRDIKRINKDMGTAKSHIKRLREEGKPLPGFKGV